MRSTSRLAIANTIVAIAKCTLIRRKITSLDDVEKRLVLDAFRAGVGTLAESGGGEDLLAKTRLLFPFDSGYVVASQSLFNEQERSGPIWDWPIEQSAAQVAAAAVFSEFDRSPFYQFLSLVAATGFERATDAGVSRDEFHAAVTIIATGVRWIEADDAFSIVSAIDFMLRRLPEGYEGSRQGFSEFMHVAEPFMAKAKQEFAPCE